MKALPERWGWFIFWFWCPVGGDSMFDVLIHAAVRQYLGAIHAS
jgi:hypothetical protein